MGASQSSNCCFLISSLLYHPTNQTQPSWRASQFSKSGDSQLRPQGPFSAEFSSNPNQTHLNKLIKVFSISRKSLADEFDQVWSQTPQESTWPNKKKSEAPPCKTMKKELEIFKMQLKMITLTIVRSRRGGGLCRAPASAEGKRVEFSVNSQSFGLSYFWLFLLGVAKVVHYNQACNIFYYIKMYYMYICTCTYIHGAAIFYLSLSIYIYIYIRGGHRLIFLI